MVSLLLDAGAEIEAKNYHLWTPLDCAAAYGQPKCAQMLLDVRAQFDAKLFVLLLRKVCQIACRRTSST